MELRCGNWSVEYHFYRSRFRLNIRMDRIASNDYTKLACPCQFGLVETLESSFQEPNTSTLQETNHLHSCNPEQQHRFLSLIGLILIMANFQNISTTGLPWFITGVVFILFWIVNFFFKKNSDFSKVQSTYCSVLTWLST